MEDRTYMNMARKKILIVSQVIPQWYIDLLKNALTEGCEIDCITGSDVNGVNLIASPRYDSVSLLTKLVSWVKHVRFVRRWERRSREQTYDLVFAVSNPPMNAALGVKLKKRFHAPFVFMNWDLYPQVIEAGHHSLPFRMLCRLWYHINDRTYPQIDAMLTLGEIMSQSACSHLSKSVQTYAMPIAADTKKIKPITKKDNPFLVKHGLQDKFIVLYSGNMGYGRNTDILLETAALMKDQKDVAFVLIGAGPYYAVTESVIRSKNLTNVHLFPLQSDDIYPFSIACGDVAFVTIRPEHAKLSVPSRTYSMMAGGSAIIALCSEHDDLQKMVEENEIGVRLTMPTPHELADKIRYLYENPDICHAMQEKARRVAEEQYSIDVISQRYRELFASLL